MNRLRTVVLLATLTALLMWLGQIFGGREGLWFALVIAGALNLGTWWFADKVVLRMYNAKEVSAVDMPELHGLVSILAARADLPMPRLYVIPEASPNAFATGRDPQHGVVAVTDGLLRVLEREETAAVIAHELGHIKHRDTLVMSVAGTLAGALSMLANGAIWGTMFGGHSEEEDDSGHAVGLLGILAAPLVATLVQMGISRSREFLADEAGARFCGNPLALASALCKIEACTRRVPMISSSPATAHLFIQNPFSGAHLGRLFSTHPSTDERVRRLRAMARPGILPVAA